MRIRLKPAGLVPRPFRYVLAASVSIVTAACGAQAPADSAQDAPLDLGAYEIVDLTHSFDERTIYWPTSPGGFVMDTLSYGMTEGGWFYSAHSVSTPEHGGTHLDAPIHFAEGGIAADAIPLERLVANAVVIDVSDRAAANSDYLLTAADLRAFETEHGLIPDGSIVLLRTGWSTRWPDRLAYLGDDTPGDASNLHFPSFGEEAATILVAERRVAALGVDVASIDGGSSADFRVHRIAGEAGVPGFENLTNLDRLPITGALVIALPMKIGGGSGGPLRAIALIPR